MDLRFIYQAQTGVRPKPGASVGPSGHGTSDIKHGNPKRAKHGGQRLLFEDSRGQGAEAQSLRDAADATREAGGFWSDRKLGGGLDWNVKKDCL